MRKQDNQVTIGLVGVHGYGAHHLRTLEAPIREGAVKLVAVADPQEPPNLSQHGDPAVFTSLTQMLKHIIPDVVILATPIHTHAPLATEAMAAGAHVLVEKPPTATFAEYEELLTTSQRTGRACQVGFQSLGSSAYGIIDDLIAQGKIGNKTGIGGVGTWIRDTGYYARSPWAGKRTLEGRAVVDGVLTNPLAHATATALRVAHSLQSDDVVGVEVDLYRAHDIEADDTSAVRIATRNQTQIGLGLLLTAAESAEPYVVVHGTEGTITFYYKTDEIVLENQQGREVFHAETTNLLLNLIDHVRTGTPLLSSLADAGAYMRMHEAVRTAPDPQPIAPEYVTWVEDELGRHPIVQDASRWATEAGTHLRTYATLGAPWARTSQELAQVKIKGQTVGSYTDGSAMSPLDSPRPHLHPLRTLGGALITDSRPLDHTWHAGVGWALQDVAGFNLWGGRTYVRNQGYTWLPDHGRIEHVDFAELTESGFVENLVWLGHGDHIHSSQAAELLRERREVSWAPVQRGGESGWELTFTTTLTNPHSADISLGSPGSNGRENGGYGGFFWRLPAFDSVEIATETAEGETATHGHRSAYLGWSATAGTGDFTLIAHHSVNTRGTESVAPPEPWFVRAAGYPGFGVSLAWDAPVNVGGGESLTRAYRVEIFDGARTVEQMRLLARG